SVSGCCSYFALGGHWPQVFAGQFERNLGGAGILRDQERMKDSSWQARRAWKSSCVSPEYLAIGRPLKQEQLPNASFANVLPNVLPRDRWQPGSRPLDDVWRISEHGPLLHLRTHIEVGSCRRE